MHVHTTRRFLCLVHHRPVPSKSSSKQAVPSIPALSFSDGWTPLDRSDESDGSDATAVQAPPENSVSQRINIFFSSSIPAIKTLEMALKIKKMQSLKKIDANHDKSIGPFITHCGWGSALEALTNGVPMIGMPLHAEQMINAVLLTDDVKVCLRPKECEDSGLIVRDKIVRVVKSLMEGEEMEKVRERAEKMKEAAVGTLLEGGLSYKAMEQVVQVLKKDVV